MPHKVPSEREHNVYLTTSVTFDNPEDDFGRLQIYQAFSSLDEANDFCEAKADELACSLGIEAPEPTVENYQMNGTFKMELALPDRHRDVTVETVIMPLMGGIIIHDKPVSRKTRASKMPPAAKPKPKKTKVQVARASDDEDQERKEASLSPKAKNSSQADHRDSIIEPAEATPEDILAAPSGPPDVYQFAHYFVIGYHHHWSEEQIKVILGRYGATIREKLPMYANDNNFYVVLGSQVPGSVLRRIKQKEFKTVTPQHLFQRIRDMRGPDSATHITSEEVAQLCKLVSGKPVTRKPIVKSKDETDSDDVEYVETSD